MLDIMDDDAPLRNSWKWSMMCHPVDQKAPKSFQYLVQLKRLLTEEKKYWFREEVRSSST